MELINTVIGVPLGYLMRFCWLLVRDYGVAIIIFTLLTKVIMFPDIAPCPEELHQDGEDEASA